MNWLLLQYRLFALRWHQRQVEWLEETRQSLEHEIVRQHRLVDRHRSQITRGTTWKKLAG